MDKKLLVALGFLVTFTSGMILGIKINDRSHKGFLPGDVVYHKVSKDYRGDAIKGVVTDTSRGEVTVLTNDHDRIIQSPSLVWEH